MNCYCSRKRWQYYFQHHQKSVNTRAHELLRLVWWNCARTRTWTLSTLEAVASIPIPGGRNLRPVKN